MAKWKKMADFTANSTVYKRAYLAWLEYGCLYRKAEGHRARRGHCDKYKSRRKGISS